MSILYYMKINIPDVNHSACTQQQKCQAFDTLMACSHLMRYWDEILYVMLV